MQKILAFFFVCCVFVIDAKAQSTNDFYFKASNTSYGGSLGVAHYIGDLNPSFDAFVPGWSASIFAKKYYNNYVALRYQLTASSFGFDDAYATNIVRKNRNLSFQTNVLEFAIQGDFHFFYYSAGSQNKNLTPYLTLGMGAFYFNPTAEWNGTSYSLRKLKTEGVSYSPVNICFPIGIGIKWGVNQYLNAGVELVHRITLTDYLDDVSTTYPSALGADEIANALSNRSLGLNGATKDMRGKQRGQNESIDMFLSLQCYLSFNVFRYYCP